MKIGFNAVVYDEKNGILTDDNANANKKKMHYPFLNKIKKLHNPETKYDINFE